MEFRSPSEKLWEVPQCGCRPRAETGGFTLVEIVFVAMVIAILATVATASYSGLLRGAREREGKVYMALYEDNVTTYMESHVVFVRADFDSWANMTRSLQYYNSEAVAMTISNSGPLEGNIITIPSRNESSARTIKSTFTGGQWVKSYVGS